MCRSLPFITLLLAVCGCSSSNEPSTASKSAPAQQRSKKQVGKDLTQTTKKSKTAKPSSKGSETKSNSSAKDDKLKVIQEGGAQMLFIPQRKKRPLTAKLKRTHLMNPYDEKAHDIAVVEKLIHRIEDEAATVFAKAKKRMALMVQIELFPMGKPKYQLAGKSLAINEYTDQLYSRLQKLPATTLPKSLMLQCVFLVGPPAPFHLESLTLLTTVDVVFESMTIKQLGTFYEQCRAIVGETYDELGGEKTKISVYATLTPSGKPRLTLTSNRKTVRPHLAALQRRLAKLRVLKPGKTEVAIRLDFETGKSKTATVGDGKKENKEKSKESGKIKRLRDLADAVHGVVIACSGNVTRISLTEYDSDGVWMAVPPRFGTKLR